MDMRKLVGENFARLRKSKDLTQEQVSEKSGFSQQYISGLERGRRNPTIVSLFELATAIGVSHIDLVLTPEMEHAEKEMELPRPHRGRNK
jgi:transcriptional regulator with XRE-family HTH domain